MHRARFDPEPPQGRGGSPLGKPRRLLGAGGGRGCGDPAGLSVPENTDPRNGGGIWRITCNSLVPCAPSCTFFPSLGSSLTGFSAPVGMVETSEFPAPPVMFLFWGQQGEGDGFGRWASGQHAPATPAWAPHRPPEYSIAADLECRGRQPPRQRRFTLV